MLPNEQNGLKNYPLIKMFNYGEDVLIYDAKPHFAFLLSHIEKSILWDFLDNLPPAEIIHDYAEALSASHLHALLARFQSLKNVGVFSKGPANEISPVDINTLEAQLKYYDANILLRKFCLEVTQNCNYACRYCKRTIAAEKGEASELNMSEEIAYKGMEYYFKKYIAFFRKLTEEKKALLLETVPPTLSWYGGEPFLNFALIQKSADYFKSLPWAKYGIPLSSIAFTANTNLSIINEDILHFLVDNNVTLFASLDGPQEQQDKCRIFPDGSGTFAVAYANLMRIKDYDPAYFQNKVTIFGVYTAEHDYQKCIDFTAHLGTLDAQHFSVEYAGTFVNDIKAETNYYRQELADGLARFEKMVEAVKDEPDSHMNKFANIFPFAKLNTDHPVGKERLNIMLTCPMAFDNLMLAANGDYLICHKVSGALPIGNCETGLNWEKLLAFYQKYNSAINNAACKSCWNVNFCSICAAARLDGEHFINPSKHECDCFRLRTEYDFNCFLLLAHKYPDLLSKIFAYRNDHKNFIGVIDINEF
ncbi:MAG: hypothetical protein GX451_03280 [Acholeplasmataceae bacterium]|nr:hypothetical protein [Acholeplasmataceae bacterium]